MGELVRGSLEILVTQAGNRHCLTECQKLLQSRVEELYVHGLRKPLLDPSFPRIDQILGEALRREDSLGDVITSGGFRRQREERCAL